ncbi:hypothetical protein CCR83_13785 [Rhodobacter veldkampii DSM 11550]|uniref:DUF3772 domain-containing protein n=1 Tax=Phaeovulum veldkampii DSM 11550 TaxID=1185920 RepID=A0A2T4JN59_9RHOB|nr:DUF3772 domain-containing protein [Phaeovulum veldkampii]MBK5947486.1 hypothetical protein [Phaeovulum veldkampii DSM 11550]PTE19187.1 DUF3772 domain-containing protein [Phaeovulum veldkampii DSM 11550]TDQ62341.1 small-conductance mechanosensitive channel [Phaeovulum veldkampii DSM 11550]
MTRAMMRQRGGAGVVGAVLRTLAMVCVLVFVLALPGAAQQAEEPDYKDWQAVAGKVEKTLTEAQTPDTELSTLRAEMVKWRNTFTNAQGVNADQIETVRGQVAALGTPPAEGEAEDPAIAKRRAELTETLASLQAPGIAAGEAASRADGLIRNIDRILRERQADKLLLLSPSPLNPVNWPAAVSLLRWTGAWIYDETIWRFTRPINWDTLRNNAPLIAVLVLVSGLLLARGGHWMGGIAGWLLGKTRMRGRYLIMGVMSLGQVLVPVMGAVLLVTALRSTSLFGPIMTRLFEMLPGLLLVVLMGWWLGQRVFPARPGDPTVLALNDERGTEGRFHAVMLGLALALHLVILNWIAPRAQDYLGGAGNIAAGKAEEIALRADAAMAVIWALLQIFAAISLFRLGQLLRRQARGQRATDDETAFRFKIFKWLGNGTILIALIAPILGWIGYISAANALIWPAISTLGVLALVATVQRFIGELYLLASQLRPSFDAADPPADGQSTAGGSLVQVLAGFVLLLVALPVLALIWGARVEDLVEVWTRFRAGVSLGGVRISPSSFVTFVAVFGIGYALTRLVQGALKSSVLPKTRIDKGGQNAIVSGLGYLGIFLATVLAITSAGIDLSSLAIVAGALSVGIGFGLQNIVSNFVSGIILLIERPISEGDWIEVGGQQGIVKSISVRSTRIETFDRTDVIIPNADFVSAQVTNWTRGNLTGRVIVKVGVAYGTDTRRVETILKEIAEAHPLVMLNPPPRVLFMGFGADSLQFEIRALLSDVNFQLSAASDMYHAIARRFAQEGIEIPFAQRDIWLRNPQALAMGAVPSRPEAAAADAPAAGTGAAVVASARPAPELMDNPETEDDSQ